MITSPWIQLGNGRAYPLATPGPVPIEVVARSLARLCRFTGHLRDFYSVAQPSCLLASLVAPDLAVHALLHDAGEVVIGDLASPLKNELDARSGGWLRELEGKVHTSILRGLGLASLDPAGESWVKRADEFALCVEARDLLTPGERSLELPHGFAVVSHIPRITRTWAPAEAEARFLEMWIEVRP